MWHPMMVTSKMEGDAKTMGLKQLRSGLDPHMILAPPSSFKYFSFFFKILAINVLCGSALT